MLSQQFEESLKLLEHKKALIAKESISNRSKYQAVQEELELLQKVRVAMESIESSIRGSFTKQISDLISYGLSLVFEKSLEFKITYSTRANAPVVDFSLKHEHGETDILSGEGGGYVNVISFLLRLILLVYSRPVLRKVIFLDESFSMVSANYLPNVANLLKELSAKLNISFVFISHESSFLDIADHIYHVENKDDVSQLVLRRNKKNFVEE